MSMKFVLMIKVLSMVHSLWKEVGQSRSQGLFSLAPGGGKMRDPGNEV